MTNTVTFKVAGNDVTAFIEQMKQKTDALTSKMIENAKKEASSSKEQLKIIEDQIKAIQRKADIEAKSSKQVVGSKRDEAVKFAEEQRQKTFEEIQGSSKYSDKAKQKLYTRGDEDYKARVNNANYQYKDQMTAIKEQERQDALQTKLLRDNIETIKSTSNQEVNQMRKGDDAIVKELDENSTPIEQFTRELSEEKHEKDSKGKKSASAGDVFGSMLGVNNIQQFIGTAGRMSQTQNGFDLIAPASQGIGQIVGTILGGAIGALVSGGTGTMVGAGLGGSLGSAVGGTSGDFLQRRAMAAQEFMGSRNRYEAQSQQKIEGIPDTMTIGLSAGEFLGVLKEIAVASGTTADATSKTSDALEMEKGLGIDKAISEGFLHIFRGTNKDLSQLVGGVMARGNGNIFQGGDYTYLNEFLGKMTGMINTLRQTTETVHTGTAFDIMRRFDKVGGAFSSRDDRSSGLINQINSSLINPGSDSLKAYSFLALRQQNPNMGIADLMMEKEKGLGSPSYLKAMLSQVDMLGGDDQFKRMQIAGMFGVNQSAAKRLYENRGALMSGKMSQEDLEETGYGAAGYKMQAEARTTPLERNTADIKNGLLRGWFDSLDSMVNAFQAAMQSAFNGATIQLQNGSISFDKQVIQNATKTPATSATKAQNPMATAPQTQNDANYQAWLKEHYEINADGSRGRVKY